jgi:hypothetical protein
VKQITINVSLPENEVFAGHAVENITFTALTEEGDPVAQAWFDFKVSNGFLTDYYGTAFADGSYSISYIAPEPKNVKKNLTVTIHVNASRFPHKNGSSYIEILVKPRSTPSTDGDPNGDDKDEPDNLIAEITKPENFNYLFIIIILIIINLIVFGALFKSKNKLKQLEESQEPKDEQKPQIYDEERALAKPTSATTKPTGRTADTPVTKPESAAITKPAPKAKPTPSPTPEPSGTEEKTQKQDIIINDPTKKID